VYPVAWGEHRLAMVYSSRRFACYREHSNQEILCAQGILGSVTCIKRNLIHVVRFPFGHDGFSVFLFMVDLSHGMLSWDVARLHVPRDVIVYLLARGSFCEWQERPDPHVVSPAAPLLSQRQLSVSLHCPALNSVIHDQQQLVRHLGN
jgi:hypothetical protein